jgi:hypothetical protein
LQVTIYATGLLSTVSEVDLFGPNGTKLSYYGNQTSHPVGNFNHINILIPAGIPVGKYDVQLVSEIGCTAYINQGKIVRSALTPVQWSS